MLSEGRGTMARVWSFVDVAACRVAWCRALREILGFSPLNIGTLSRCCVLGQSNYSPNASLDSLGENE